MHSNTAYMRIFLHIMSIFFLLTGCGTAINIDKQIDSPSGTTARSARYALGTCLSKDDRATAQTCDSLKEHVEYMLLSNNLLGNEDTANRIIRLTISYYNNSSSVTRGMLGPLAGKEGMDVIVEIVDRNSNNVIGSASVSFYNYLAANTSEEMMADRISSKVIDYLRSGKTE